MVADTLRRWAVPGLVWFHCPNEGLRSRRVNPKTGATYSPEAQRLARMGLRAGTADLLIVPPPDGLLHGLELKRRGEKPTDDQVEFGADLEAAGGVWDWADSYDGAIAILKRWGALRTTITPS